MKKWISFLILTLALLIEAAPAPAPAAKLWTGFRRVPTESTTVINEPIASRPPYRQWFINSQFNSRQMRITDNDAAQFTFAKTGAAGRWGDDARHHYSKDQPWSCNEEWLVVDNRGDGAVPGGEVILEVAQDYRPYKPLDCGDSLLSFYDQRWSQRPNHGREMWGILNDDGTLMTHGRLQCRDVISCVNKQTFTFSDSLGPLDGGDAGIGRSEGNGSDDDWFAIGRWNGTQLRLQIVDPNGTPRISFVQVVPDPGVANTEPDWWTLTPSGQYLVVKYHGSGRQEAMRVFKVQTGSPGFGTITPMHYVCGNSGTGNTGENIGIYNRVAAYATASTDTVKGDTTGFYQTPKNGGWVSSGSHADIGRDSDSSGVDVLVFLPRGWGSSHTEIAVTNLATGVSRSLMKETPSGAGAKIQSPEHVSCRNTERDGWAYITMTHDSIGDGGAPNRPMRDEVIAIKFTSNPNAPTVQRVTQMHATKHRDPATWPGEQNSCPSGVDYCYKNEPQFVPSPDGREGLYASNWKRSCFFGCGPSLEQRCSYVVDIACRPPQPVIDLAASSPDTATLIIEWTMPGSDTIGFGAPRVVEVRYSNTELSEGNFTDGTALSPQPTVSSGRYGQVERASITGLSTGSIYYIAMKISSDCGEATPVVVACQGTRTTGGGAPPECRTALTIPKPPAPCDGCGPHLAPPGGLIPGPAPQE